MDCSIPASSIAEALPEHVKILVLDLAPNMQHLYASFFAKDPKQAAVARVPLSQKERHDIRRLQRRMEV